MNEDLELNEIVESEEEHAESDEEEIKSLRRAGENLPQSEKASYTEAGNNSDHLKVPKSTVDSKGFKLEDD
jgi:hypothetical protein